MPRLLINGSWYDPVAGSSIYESSYEATILRHSAELFPGFICVPFKARVESEYGTAQPDLALIDRRYRTWFVVEVELDSHPLAGHVEPQVQKFAAGSYDSRHAEALCRKSPALDPARVKEMMLGQQPKVLVLVTGHKPDWAPRMAQYGCSVGVIEMFRDDLDQVVLRVNGDQPQALDEEIVSQCTGDSYLRKALRLLSPAPFQGLPRVDLLFEGFSTQWQVVRVKDAAWLVPEGQAVVSASTGSKWVIRRVVEDLILTSVGG